jgi:hypothetical protein
MGLVLVIIFAVGFPDSVWAEQPCDRYPASDQMRCERVWKEINNEAVGEMADFGMRQLKRREEGKITQEQHLQQNFDFIKQSAQKRLKVLSERMSQDK